MNELVSLAFLHVIIQVFCIDTSIVKKLNDGYNMPMLALGVDNSVKDLDKLEKMIVDAVEAGYRHIDTSPEHRNEHIVGKAIANVIERGIVSRFELFITAKLPNTIHRKNDVLESLKATLRRLSLVYVDLYLIRSPYPMNETGVLTDINIAETWKGMELARSKELTMSIGLTNFNETWVDRTIQTCKIPPAVNQIEVHPYLTEEELVMYCKSYDVSIMAHHPMGFLERREKSEPPTNKTFYELQIDKFAEKYNKSPAQIVMRYAIDRHMTPVAAVTDKETLIDYYNIFDFQLTPLEVVMIGNNNANRSVFDD